MTWKAASKRRLKRKQNSKKCRRLLLKNDAIIRIWWRRLQHEGEYACGRQHAHLRAWLSSENDGPFQYQDEDADADTDACCHSHTRDHRQKMMLVEMGRVTRAQMWASTPTLRTIVTKRCWMVRVQPAFLGKTNPAKTIYFRHMVPNHWKQVGEISNTTQILSNSSRGGKKELFTVQCC